MQQRTISYYKNVTIASGASLELAGNITVSGGWSNAGALIHNSRTVSLDGSIQTITGNTTFFNLTKTVIAADTLTFFTGSTTTVIGAMTLQGESGHILSFRSSSAGTQWNIDPQGARTVAYLDMKDSRNTNATDIDAIGTNRVNSGNNTNWLFNRVPFAVTVNLSEPGKTESYLGKIDRQMDSYLFNFPFIDDCSRRCGWGFDR